MVPLVLEEPVFTKNQVVSATEESKSLSTIRRRAKRALGSLPIMAISIP